MLLTKVVALDTFINQNFNMKNIWPVQVYSWGPLLCPRTPPPEPPNFEFFSDFDETNGNQSGARPRAKVWSGGASQGSGM